MENVKFYEKLDEIDKYFLDVKKYKPLSKKEEFALADKIQQGDEEALQKLVNANLRFVITIAKQYRNTGICFSDLISEGNIGLMKAAAKFDRNRGVKFISYAVWWIRSSINEYINSLNKYDAVSCDDLTLNNHVKSEYEYSATLINEEFENEITDMQSRNASIEDLLQSLETRERKILALYFGLHYDIISAFIKSIRGSDPDAALYWLARMVAAGEDPKFIARRLVISASEDIGLANPNAMLVANACFDTLQKIGWPEGRIPLAMATVYLATSQKSNSAYLAINQALELVVVPS